MPLMDHLIELRRRLMYSIAAFLAAFFACYAVHEPIYGFLVVPLARIMKEVGGSQRLIYTALTEGFFTNMKVSAFAALLVTFPIFATQIWRFIAPGLYRNEKRAMLPFLVATPVLFAVGASLAYYVVMPLAWRFLLGFQTTSAETVLPIQLEAKMSEYLSLVMTLIFAFGLCFELPVALTLMARVGLVTSKGLADKRRFAMVGAFIVAAILTPPDVVSQTSLAIPLIGLYEISILSCRYVEKQRRSDDDAAAQKE
ncbi:MAG: twin-arginine translocase subunit TatC [Alphaproteobacteria bacterium]|nr:twin-arginine translocase subunit TatC [Alphaproteobacteria bacterium]